MRKIKVGKKYCMAFGLKWLKQQLIQNQLDGKPQEILGKVNAEGVWSYIDYQTAFNQIDNYIKRGYDCYPCEHADKKGYCKGTID